MSNARIFDLAGVATERPYHHGNVRSSTIQFAVLCGPRRRSEQAVSQAIQILDAFPDNISNLALQYGIEPVEVDVKGPCRL